MPTAPLHRKSMNNKKLVFQIKTEEISLPYIVLGASFALFLFSHLVMYSVVSSTQWLVFALLPTFALLLCLAAYLYRVANAPKMNFYVDGTITCGTSTFHTRDYLGITTIIQHKTDEISEPYDGVMPTQIVLIHKDTSKENLPVFEIPLIFHRIYKGIELHEIVQLKKQLAQATRLPIFEDCQAPVLRDQLIPWQEKENRNHLLVYQSKQQKSILYSIVLALIHIVVFQSRRREIILLSILFALSSLMEFIKSSVIAHKPLYIQIFVLIIVALYILLYKYRFVITYTAEEMTLGNRSLSCAQQEIAYRDIQQITIRDIHSQNYYAYSRLDIALNNGKKIKLCVSTPHVRDPQKLRSLLAAKLRNKLVDANRPHPPHSRGA